MLLSVRVSVSAAVLICWFSATGIAQPKDFSFRFEVGSCLPERFDTSTRVFTKSLGGGKGADISDFRLADAQMTTIYQTVQEIRFFEYPANFSGVLAAGGKRFLKAEPNITYRLEVHGGGKVHAVEWNDGIPSLTPEGERLRDLFLMIAKFIHNHPTFKQLPPSDYGCL